MVCKRMVYRFFTLCMAVFLTAAFSVNAQNKSEVYRLDNGLTVYLNEVPEAPYITGSLAIRCGSKYDPADATGIAHYLEHMLFKGTRQLGTINYQEESIYLDSIEQQYEKLQQYSDVRHRDSIRKIINRLSGEAGRYAIPNEMDKILDHMGARGINAFTGMEQNAYYNHFPENQMEKWLRLYAHRFKHPVFRLFQSELETVFEEKNMYNDQFETVLIEKFFEAFYQKHPYGQQTVLGKAEHIKNPSLKEMKNFYERYYVANNMALFLSGPFDSEEVKPMIERWFSDLPERDLPEFEVPREESIDGRQVVTERITPVRAGLIGFRTVPVTHPDKPALDVLHAMLTNRNGTGKLDQLGKNNDLLFASVFSDMRIDYGSSVFLFVPKLLFQTFRKAENLVMDEVEKIKLGDFETETLAAVKRDLQKNSELQLEGQEGRMQKLMEAFFFDKTWEGMLAYPQKIAATDKDDIIEVANKYYADDFLVFRSRMGFPDKEKLEKPGYDPVNPAEPEASSVFAKKLDEMETAVVEPDFIDFTEDLKIVKTEDYRLFHVENPFNEMFNISLRFQTGTLEQPALTQLATYLQECGSRDLQGNSFAAAMQKLGSSMQISADRQYFTISMDGHDSHLDSSLVLLNSLLHHPAEDKDAMKSLVRMRRLESRYEQRKPAIKANALIEKIMFGEKSGYLNRLDTKAVRKADAEDMTGMCPGLLDAPLNIHYSGKLLPEEIEKILNENLNPDRNTDPEKPPVYRRPEMYDADTIFVVNDKKALQSNIYFYVPGVVDTERDIVMAKAFNQYFGIGMSSIVFQEIRELRSMAYSAYAFYQPNNNKNYPGYFKAFIGTQADKTVDAIHVFDSLLTNLPHKPGRMDGLQTSLKQSVNMENPGFRKISYLAENWINRSYQHDPREYRYDLYDDVSMKSLNDFHATHLRGRPVIIAVVGNLNQIDMEGLKTFGHVVELDAHDVMN
ncbi:MAG: M16 family metallopeptidase [Bacteroidota bacterium]